MSARDERRTLFYCDKCQAVYALTDREAEWKDCAAPILLMARIERCGGYLWPVLPPEDQEPAR